MLLIPAVPVCVTVQKLVHDASDIIRELPLNRCKIVLTLVIDMIKPVKIRPCGRTTKYIATVLRVARNDVRVLEIPSLS